MDQARVLAPPSAGYISDVTFERHAANSDQKLGVRG